MKAGIIMNKLVEQIGDNAITAFKSGYNCAESTVQAFRMAGVVDISEESLRLASGFGGGLGKARSLCGALSGCTMVLSSIAGRSNPHEKPLQEVYDLSREFHDLFKSHFSSVMCVDLMGFEFGTREHLKTCLVLSKDTAVLLANFLDGKDLLKVRLNNA